ncbi:MAG: SH3 domain-containing protein [Chloroflexi bacterium OHK40]
MQDLLSQLDSAIVIGLIVAVIIVLVVVVLLVRNMRRRQASPPESAGMSLGGPIDYTSLPIDEEPSGWRERFARLSLAGKLLAVLVPILALLGLVALVLTLLPPATQTAGPPPPLVPLELTVTDAVVNRAEPLTIGIDVETSGLEDGAVVTAELLEDGQPFPWLNPETARATVRRNRAEIEARRADGAPQPTEGRRYTVVVRGPEGVVSAEVELQVPEVNRIADSFYGRAAAAPTAAPTAVPTAAHATAAPTATQAAATPAPTAAPELPSGPAVGVGNGGNVRRLPLIAADNVVGGINAGEQVQVLARTPNGEWYRVRTVRDELGWVSVTLLDASQIPADVPVASIVTVFVNGPLYERPDTASTELDRVNQGEVVELLQRTSAGDWYQATNVREITGWVPADLLGIPAEVAAAVPVAP